jgi:hypothetical protein
MTTAPQARMLKAPQAQRLELATRIATHKREAEYCSCNGCGIAHEMNVHVRVAAPANRGKTTMNTTLVKHHRR